MAHWRWHIASIAGTTHEAAGTESNDAVAGKVIGDAVFLAVADGAGSARRATAGATTAVNAAVSALAASGVERRKSDDAIVECLAAAMDAAILAIDDAARRAEAPADEFATTLLLCVLTPRALYAAQIGDGAIVAVVDREYQVLCAAPRSEFLNETTFVTSRNARDTMATRIVRARRRDDLKHVAVLTDGLQSIALNLRDDSAHAPFFSPLFAWAQTNTASSEGLEEFLRSPRVRAASGDDLTLTLVVDPRVAVPKARSEMDGLAVAGRSSDVAGAPTRRTPPWQGFQPLVEWLKRHD